MGRKAIIVLELFVAAGAIPAGIFMLIDPTQGLSLHMKREWLADSPFGSFLVPGLFLAAVIGGGFLLAAVSHLRRAWFAPHVSFTGGGILCVWILVQLGLAEVPLNVLHPLMFLIGAAVSLLALREGVATDRMAAPGQGA